jgi:hypothetical protein
MIKGCNLVTSYTALAPSPPPHPTPKTARLCISCSRNIAPEEYPLPISSGVRCCSVVLGSIALHHVNDIDQSVAGIIHHLLGLFGHVTVASSLALDDLLDAFHHLRELLIIGVRLELLRSWRESLGIGCLLLWGLVSEVSRCQANYGNDGNMPEGCPEDCRSECSQPEEPGRQRCWQARRCWRAWLVYRQWPLSLFSSQLCQTGCSLEPHRYIAGGRCSADPCVRGPPHLDVPEHSSCCVLTS